MHQLQPNSQTTYTVRLFLSIITLMLVMLNACAPTRERCERNYGPCGVALTDTVFQVRTRWATLPEVHAQPMTFTLDNLLASPESTQRIEQGRFWAAVSAQQGATPDAPPLLVLEGGCRVDSVMVHDTVYIYPPRLPPPQANASVSLPPYAHIWLPILLLALAAAVAILGFKLLSSK